MSEGVLRVVQLNADSLVGPGWVQRRQEIVTWLDSLDADVVCLQEIWQDHRHPNTGGWIAEHAAGDWRPGGAGRVVAASLAFHEPLTGTLASDHYGLCVDVIWPTRPPS